MQLVEDSDNSRLSQEVAERSLQLRYIYASLRAIFWYAFVQNITRLTINRRMRGEELQGLSIEELQHLEKSLEAGLSHVIEKKVSVSLYRCCYVSGVADKISFRPWLNMFDLWQGEKIMKEINQLQERVWLYILAQLHMYRVLWNLSN